MNMDQDILLQMTDITKTFPGVKALDHVSLTSRKCFQVRLHSIRCT